MLSGSAVEMKRLVRGDRVLDAGDRAAGMRPAAGRDEDVRGAHMRPGAQETDRVRILDHRAALDDLDAGLLEVGAVGRLEPRDLLVLVGDERRPVEGRRRHRPAEARGIGELVGKPRGVDEELLRHAAADHAGAADPILLGDHHLGAVTRGDPGRAHAAGAGADDEEVDVVRRGSSQRVTLFRHFGPDAPEHRLGEVRATSPAPSSCSGRARAAPP